MNFDQIVSAARSVLRERQYAETTRRGGHVYESLRAEAMARVNEDALRNQANRLLGDA